MGSPITRRVHIEFISKDTVIITNAYIQKTFHLDKLHIPGKATYINLVKMNTVGDANNSERFLASPTKNKDGSFGLDIMVLPDYSKGDWQRVGLANMGRFEYWLKGGYNGIGPDVIQAVEGTFSVKIIY